MRMNGSKVDRSKGVSINYCGDSREGEEVLTMFGQ